MNAITQILGGVGAGGGLVGVVTYLVKNGLRISFGTPSVNGNGHSNGTGTSNSSVRKAGNETTDFWERRLDKMDAHCENQTKILERQTVLLEEQTKLLIELVAINRMSKRANG